jgi:DNA-binding NarL/FixJ family response regulator
MNNIIQPRILLADDHSLIRKSIKFLCQWELGFAEIGEVENCNGLMKELARHAYTHLVLDINLADGSSLEVLPNIRSLYPHLRILILSMQPMALYRKVLKEQYGVIFFINKVAPEEDTVRLLRQFLQNKKPDSDIAGGLDNNPFSDLTSREIEVLHYVLQGIGTKEISDNLNLKHNTVSTFKKKIYGKTQTTNLKELIDLARVYRVN